MLVLTIIINMLIMMGNAVYMCLLVWVCTYVMAFAMR